LDRRDTVPAPPFSTAVNTRSRHGPDRAPQPIDDDLPTLHVLDFIEQDGVRLAEQGLPFPVLGQQNVVKHASDRPLHASVMHVFVKNRALRRK
jgi:hypothetical protein